MKKNAIITALLCLTATACTSVIRKTPSEMELELTSKETSATCFNAQTLANSLHIQELDLKDKSETELLDTLGIKTLQNYGLHPVGARRVSGECVKHLDEFYTAILHFDTGITLQINQGNFTPYPTIHDLLNFIDIDDAHPTIPSRNFIQAIDIGGGHVNKNAMTKFIGAWIENKKYIITPYKKAPSETFHVYNDLLESEKPVLSIRFMHHLHTPSGVIFLIQENGAERILVNFIWTYSDLFSNDVD